MANKKNLKQNRKGKEEPGSAAPLPVPVTIDRQTELGTPDPQPQPGDTVADLAAAAADIVADKGDLDTARDATMTQGFSDPAPLPPADRDLPSGGAIWDGPNPPMPDDPPPPSHDAIFIGAGPGAIETRVVERDPAPETTLLETTEGLPDPHEWDDPRRMVADIERHAKHSHGLTPDTDLLLRIANYIRLAWGVSEEMVPKP